MWSAVVNVSFRALRLADVRVWPNVRFAPILLQKSAVTDHVVRPVHFGAMGFAPDPDALYATFTLRNT